MKILYFAWLKEHTGIGSEQSAGHSTALANLDTVRVAVNRVYGDLATPITNDDEVAFFPPVTGG